MVHLPGKPPGTGRLPPAVAPSHSIGEHWSTTSTWGGGNRVYMAGWMEFNDYYRVLFSGRPWGGASVGCSHAAPRPAAKRTHLSFGTHFFTSSRTSFAVSDPQPVKEARTMPL